MAAFSQTSFNAARYLSARPAYPSRVYNVLKKYHYELYGGAPPAGLGATVAIDLGCGPGTATHSLSRFPFSKTIGIEPSPQMISVAQNSARDISKLIVTTETDAQPGEVEFKAGNAEETVKELSEASVDFIGAGQAAHWFDYEGELYDVFARVLKERGTVAFWGYGEMYFPFHPELSAAITQYSGETLRDFWQQPGRSKTEQLLQPIPFPPDNGKWDTSSFVRIQCPSPTLSIPEPTTLVIPDNSVNRQLLSGEDLYLEEEWTTANLLEYLKTWSSAHVYNRKHGLEGDEVIEKQVWKKFDESFKEDEKFIVRWPMGFIMFKRSGGK
ncbi:hypothetical protein BT69DRAFT_1055131 [Atractiella rhizophila]|nr:hypothetical protein BT69DRAFT_1055131 [Atractiella rhizophila]